MKECFSGVMLFSLNFIVVNFLKVGRYHYSLILLNLAIDIYIHLLIHKTAKYESKNSILIVLHMSKSTWEM